MEKTRLLLISDVHYCQEEYGGISRDETLRRLVDQIRTEHEKEPVSHIHFLGDYSLDHWAWKTFGTWLTEGKSYTKDVADRFMQALPAPYYMLPGNHEQYGEALWQQLTGCSRSAEFVVGDYLILLWDSYGADLDPTEHSDGTYTPPDIAKLRARMDAHPDKKVILCSHYFMPALTEEEAAFIADPRILCLCQGHTHFSAVNRLPAEYGSKPVLQTGAWASVGPTGAYSWGVRELVLESGRLSSAYLVWGQTLGYREKTYTVAPCRKDEAEICW